MKNRPFTTFLLLILTGALMALPNLAEAARVHGVFRVVKGKVQVKSGKTGKTKRAKLGKKVYPGDTIVTSKDARAKIVMIDKNEINVSPESEVTIENYKFDPKKGKKNVLLKVLYGKVRSKVKQKYDGKENKFQVKTPSAVAGVRGTDFFCGFNNVTNATKVVTFEGSVEFGLPGAGGTIANPVTVGVGQFTVSMGNQPPAPPANLSKNQLDKMNQESNVPDNSDKGPDNRVPAGDNQGGDDGNKDSGDGTSPDGAGTNDGNRSPDSDGSGDTATSDRGTLPPPPDVEGDPIIEGSVDALPPPPPPPPPPTDIVDVIEDPLRDPRIKEPIQSGNTRLIITITNGP